MNITENSIRGLATFHIFLFVPPIGHNFALFDSFPRCVFLIMMPLKELNSLKKLPFLIYTI